MSATVQSYHHDLRLRSKHDQVRSNILLPVVIPCPCSSYDWGWNSLFPRIVSLPFQPAPSTLYLYRRYVRNLQAFEGI